MKAIHTGLMSASNGTVVVNDTVEFVANANGFFMNEDTVIARIEINGDTTTDVKDDYITTPATAVKSGVLITPKGNDYFSAITLTSGSVTVILA